MNLRHDVNKTSDGGGDEKIWRNKKRQEETKSLANLMLRYLTKPETFETDEVLDDGIDMCKAAHFFSFTCDPLASDSSLFVIFLIIRFIFFIIRIFVV